MEEEGRGHRRTPASTPGSRRRGCRRFMPCAAAGECARAASPARKSGPCRNDPANRCWRRTCADHLRCSRVTLSPATARIAWISDAGTSSPGCPNGASLCRSGRVARMRHVVPSPSGETKTSPGEPTATCSTPRCQVAVQLGVGQDHLLAVGPTVPADACSPPHGAARTVATDQEATGRLLGPTVQLERDTCDGVIDRCVDQLDPGALPRPAPRTQ
jgi:hypothetical protein